MLLRKLQALTVGRAVWSKRQKDSGQSAPDIETLDAVCWVKARLDDNEAARREETRGYPVERHALNEGADAPASKETDAHF